MADYDFRPGGSLKFKGGVSEGGIVKKKKKPKSKPKLDDRKEEDRERVKDLLRNGESDPSPGPASGSSSPPLSNGNDRKTDAERRFEEAQRRRLLGKVGRMAHKTHKDRVNEFNAKLEALSEHHDIPKVGPG